MKTTYLCKEISATIRLYCFINKKKINILKNANSQSFDDFAKIILTYFISKAQLKITNSFLSLREQGVNNDQKIVDIMEVYTFASVGFVVLKVKMGAFCSI